MALETQLGSAVPGHRESGKRRVLAECVANAKDPIVCFAREVIGPLRGFTSSCRSTRVRSDAWQHQSPVIQLHDVSWLQHRCSNIRGTHATLDRRGVSETQSKAPTSRWLVTGSFVNNWTGRVFAAVTWIP